VTTTIPGTRWRPMLEALAGKLSVDGTLRDPAWRARPDSGAQEGEQFSFKKGGAALVDLPEGPSGAARLLWFLKPKILRALARD